MNAFDPNDLPTQVRFVKRSLHGMMNGPVSASMREKGLTYKVNFGVELPRLREFATSLPHTYELASALWKEDIRECRILAGLLMPAEKFDSELADVWVEQMRFAEEAECTVMNLFVHLKDASDKAFEWMAAEQPLTQVCGYLLLARLLMGGARLTERDEQEFLDHAATALAVDSPMAVRSAAQKCLMKFMDAGEREEQMAEAMLAQLES